MNEARDSSDLLSDPRPELSDLLQALRDRARQIDPAQRARRDVHSVLETLRQGAQQMSPQVHLHEVGTVQQVGDGVAKLSGLAHASTDELVTFPTGVQGLILSLDPARVDVILLGPDEGIQGGDLVTSTKRRLQVPVGPNLLGRVVNPLGHPLDERGAIDVADCRYLERDPPGIVERAPVDEPLHTGLKIVDALLPIGRGQRELIVGDRQTGKTTLAVDTILSQRDHDVQCIYVAIGQRKSSTLAVIETLRVHGAMAYTAVLVSGPDDPPALRYLAPYAGCTMAEFLMDQGQDVLIVFDDLSKHADAYRELSLLLRRPPGREAYPGDVFYLHARLLERACKLNQEAGGGSLTALPIVEMQQGNIAAYIPTNLISICDGQIVLDADLFNRGDKPAVDVGRSVSRVGGAAQSPAMLGVVGQLRLELSQYEEVARFTRFGTEVDETTRRQIQRGQRLRAVLTQPAHQPLSLGAQIAVFLAATEGLLDDVPADRVSAFETGLLDYLASKHSDLIQSINRSGGLPSETRETLVEALSSYRATWREGRNEG